MTLKPVLKRWFKHLALANWRRTFYWWAINPTGKHAIIRIWFRTSMWCSEWECIRKIWFLLLQNFNKFVLIFNPNFAVTHSAIVWLLPFYVYQTDWTCHWTLKWTQHHQMDYQLQAIHLPISIIWKMESATQIYAKMPFYLDKMGQHQQLCTLIHIWISIKFHRRMVRLHVSNIFCCIDFFLWKNVNFSKKIWFFWRTFEFFNENCKFFDENLNFF